MTLTVTRIMKVGDMICVADFHDRTGLTFRRAPCHATTRGPGTSASRAVLAFVRHLKNIHLTFRNLFVVTYNFQTRCHFLRYDKK